MSFASRGWSLRSASVVALLASVLVGGGLASSPLPRAGRALVAAVTAVLATVQLAFLQRYGSPFDAEVARATVRYWGDIRPVLTTELPRLGALFACVLVVEGALVTLSPRVRLRTSAGLAFGGLLLALLGGPRAATPEVRAVLALRPLLERRASAAVAEARIELPPRDGAPSPPSVVLVVTESVRADEYCSAFDPACTTSPAVNALLPDRVPLRNLRSLGSYTVLSMATLSTGRPQAVSRAELVRMPTVFEYLAATRAGDRPVTTAYWSSHCHPVFERPSVRDAVSSYLTAEDFVGDQEWHDDTDERVLAHFAREVGKLPRPFFVLLHLIGTHTPYAMNRASAPFVPYDWDYSWSGLPRLRNAYRNAIHHQDALLARALSTLTGGPPTLVVLTSDHGEEFGEHKQIHHGQDVLDSQVHVPGFVAEVGEALSASQRASLRGAERAFVTHVDVLPTILDAFGVLDAEDPVRKPLPGRSLLRALPPPVALPMTNCSEAFPCPFRSWGMMQGAHRLEAQQWDPGWNCWRLDPAEATEDMAHPACRALVDASRGWFAELPGGAANRLGRGAGVRSPRLLAKRKETSGIGGATVWPMPMVDRESLRLHTPPGQMLPHLLQDFCDWFTQHGDQAGNVRIVGDRLDDCYVEDGSRIAPAFVSFLGLKDGSRVGWWRPDGAALAEAPVALLGSEGELRVVALGLAELLSRWATGSTGIEDLGGQPNARMARWLRERSGGGVLRCDDAELERHTGQLEGWFEAWSTRRNELAAVDPHRVALARELLPVIGRPSQAWERTFAEAVMTGTSCRLFGTLVGQKPLPASPELVAALEALREHDADELPEAGLWFRAVFQMGADGVLGVKRTYLEEPNPRELQLDVAGLQEDLLRRPRSAYWMPSWLARCVDQGG